MAHFRRKLQPSLLRHLSRGKSILLLGPRQVGKTTLLSTLPADLNVNLVDRTLRLAYERRPQR
jgi:predicted AAA+ superfamily ATPase